LPESTEAPVDRSTFPAPDFDVRHFAHTAAGSHRDALNLSNYRANPVSAETLRVLRYLQIVERATMTHLRSVLVTATHKDARITAFLTTWAYEKFWIADALEQIALVHAAAGTEPDRAPFRTPGERTIREAVYANIVGVPMIGVHMTLSTVDEWLTQAAYARIIQLEGNRQLTETIESLLALKRRQLSFFEAQARFRLSESSRAAQLARKRLARTPWPVGAKAEPRAETDNFFAHTFGRAPEIVAILDARIDTLPGQSGLSLLRKAAKL
jgi:hypothetical protein